MFCVLWTQSVPRFFSFNHSKFSQSLQKYPESPVCPLPSHPRGRSTIPSRTSLCGSTLTCDPLSLPLCLPVVVPTVPTSSSTCRPLPLYSDASGCPVPFSNLNSIDDVEESIPPRMTFVLEFLKTFIQGPIGTPSS